MCTEREVSGSDALWLIFSKGPLGCCVGVVRAGQIAESGGPSFSWLTPHSSSPVQTEVREPVLDDYHHVADCEEEGGDLE